MLFLGLLLLVIGYVVPVPVLMTVGWILVVVGVILLLLGGVGQPVAGRRWWF